MSKRKTLKRNKKKKKPLRNRGSIGGSEGALKKKPNKSFESAAIRAGKAPRDRKKRMAIKANVQSQLKSIKLVQKQKPQTKKPLTKRQSIAQKPSLIKRASTAVKKAVSNTMRKGMQMLKKMATSIPKKSTRKKTIKQSSPKR